MRAIVVFPLPLSPARTKISGWSDRIEKLAPSTAVNSTLERPCWVLKILVNLSTDNNIEDLDWLWLRVILDLVFC